MTDVQPTGTRERLLASAVELIAAATGQDVPMRAVCEQAGVRLPTLYHFFGSKQGLLDAVVAVGFDRHLAGKQAREHTGDPIADLRGGWDTHVAFGLANPGLYMLMYGQARPGAGRPPAAATADAMLLELTRAAAAQGRLQVPAELAAEHVLASNVGVTLFLISATGSDAGAEPGLSASVREATITAITGRDTPTSPLTHDARRVLDHLAAATPTPGLDEPERALLRKWLGLLA